MGLLFKWIIFFSSYVPVFIMIFLNNLDSFDFPDVSNTWYMNQEFWKILILLSLISIVVLYIWLRHLKKESKNNELYEIRNVKSYDSEILNFFVTFIIPIVSLKPDSWPSIVMNLLLLIIEGVFFVRNNTLYFNIVLLVVGYRVYTFGEDNIIITKKSKEELEDLKASQMGTTNIFYV